VYFSKGFGNHLLVFGRFRRFPRFLVNFFSIFPFKLANLLWWVWHRGWGWFCEVFVLLKRSWRCIYSI